MSEPLPVYKSAHMGEEIDHSVYTAHEHENKSAIDKFTEQFEELYWNGKPAIIPGPRGYRGLGVFYFMQEDGNLYFVYEEDIYPTHIFFAYDETDGNLYYVV